MQLEFSRSTTPSVMKTIEQLRGFETMLFIGGHRGTLAVMIRPKYKLMGLVIVLKVVN